MVIYRYKALYYGLAYQRRFVMTRKNRKGVVGKKNPTLHNREAVGVGLSFTDEHVSSGEDIEKKIKEKRAKK